MKKLIIYLFSFTFLYNCSNDETITIPVTVVNDNLFIGDVTLTSQAEVETFSAENYTGIVGALIIGSPDELTDITDISGLNTMDYVSRSIAILNTNLISIDGLININRPPEEDRFEALRIENNPLLMNIDGLMNIVGNLNRVSIENNFSLTSISGLGGIFISGFISIRDNPALLSLNNVNFINPDNTPTGRSISIIGNNSLTSLAGLNLTPFMSSINIIDNENLKSLDGLQNLEALSFVLTIINNDSLEDLSALSGLNSQLFGFNLEENDALTNLNGLENIETFGDLEMGDLRVFIRNNKNLSDFCAVSDIPFEANGGPGFADEFDISGNAFNPTLQADRTIGANCSL